MTLGSSSGSATTREASSATAPVGADAKRHAAVRNRLSAAGVRHAVDLAPRPPFYFRRVGVALGWRAPKHELCAVVGRRGRRCARKITNRVRVDGVSDIRCSRGWSEHDAHQYGLVVTSAPRRAVSSTRCRGAAPVPHTMSCMRAGLHALLLPPLLRTFGYDALSALTPVP